MKLGDEIRASIVQGDSSQMRHFSNMLEDSQLGRKGFLEKNFIVLENALYDPAFRAMTGGWELLLVLDLDQDKMSAAQRDRLRQALAEVFGNLSDWMGNFFLSELFGKLFPDDRGIEVLERLGRVDDDVSRSLVAHSLEHVVKKAEGELRKRAFQMLLNMANDPSPQVLHEVALSLSRLQRIVGDAQAGQIDSTMDKLRVSEANLNLK